MEIAEHVEHLGTETARLAERVAAVGLDATVPTCPGWTMRNLVEHVGMAHRWAAAVIEQRAQSGKDVSAIAARGDVPADDGLLDWLAAGSRHLADVVAATPIDAEFWRFMRNAPSSVAFWARRQAHETAIHRVDAELSGPAVTPTAVDADFAADGVDELLLGFAPKYPAAEGEAKTLHLVAADDPGRWTATIGGGAVKTAAGLDGDADLTITGTASDLYLLMWNRVELDGLDVSGDLDAWKVWRSTVAV